MSLRKTDCWSGGSKELMQGLILAGGFKNETSEGIDFITISSPFIFHNLKSPCSTNWGVGGERYPAGRVGTSFLVAEGGIGRTLDLDLAAMRLGL